MKLCLQCSEPFETEGWTCPYCKHQPILFNGRPSFAPEFSTDTGFKDGHFKELAELEERNFWFQARNQIIIWALQRYFPDAKNMLEVGCGTGFVLSDIATTRPTLQLSGSELSCIGLAFAANRVPRLNLFQMDARSIPFIDEFDVIGAFDVLEHIEEDDKVLRQLCQAVHPGGGIILTVPQHPWLWSRSDEFACHCRRYSASELQKKIRSAGFQIVRATSFVSLLLPLMLLSRWRHHNRSLHSDPLNELKISNPLNMALKGVMTLERVVIQAGCNFPAGGSLLLIARKMSE